MALTLGQIEGIAPDQASLKAASKLMKPAKWPLRSKDNEGQYIWGECQGSGSNPYRVMADITDLGYKCTCPSRKFPCKHSLALMWMYAEGEGDFTEASVPEWVTDWVGRRRNTGTAPAKPDGNGESKSISAATVAEPAKPVDPKAAAKKAAAAKKREADTRQSVIAATHELEQWIADQLRGGLSAFMQETPERCRRIAARLVDAKAQSLAGRVDELPARVAGLGAEERLNAVISELGKLVLLVRAWRQNPTDPALHRTVITAESREQVLASNAPSVTSQWEVAGERISTRKDGLVSQETWLINLSPGEHPYALLLDFFPATLGKRSSAFSAGEQFTATLKFYADTQPLRALIADRSATEPGNLQWPDSLQTETVRDQIINGMHASPWSVRYPMALPGGRFCKSDNDLWWWMGTDTDSTLPLSGALSPCALGAALTTTFGLWDGKRLDPISAISPQGRITL